MRLVLLLAAGTFLGGPAVAADQLKYGSAPSWVVPQAVPDKPTNGADAPIAFLLSDTQVRFEAGKTTTFTEVAMKVQTADGLSGGNIAIPWQPSTDTITVNKLHIIRGGKVIDVLGAGQTFTVLRRETNLEAAMLDGSLTGTIQPEGLQVGDIVDFATTDEHVDPVMKGHVEGNFATWNDLPIEFGHVKMAWPDSMHLLTKESANLPKPQLSTSGGWHVLEMSARAIQPIVAPKGAPARFLIARLGEVSDFASWSDLADLMRPLYAKAATIPQSGALRDELETIRKSAKTPKEKAEKALQLVEQRVRYVALEMGTGGYVPVDADVTWSRRYGDCKGKTALLLALLHELGIQAEAVIVHHSLGDILPDRLPMASYFDHVIVRAHLSGKDYWLDGTRTGDSDIDRIPVPNFKWGLPLVENAKLAALTPEALAEPQVQTAIDIDASAGAYAAVPFKADQTIRGDGATALNTAYSQLSATQLDAVLKEYWRSQYDYVDIQAAGWKFDPGRNVATMTMSGTATLDWDGGFYVPASSLAYKPDFSRADGPFHDAPFAMQYPAWNTSSVTVHLPATFAGRQKNLPQAVKEEEAANEYIRTIRIDGPTVTVDTSERSIQAELPYKDAIAAAPRLKALYDEDVYLRVPDDYVANAADLAGLAARKPASASAFVDRGNIYLNASKFKEAIADFTEANRLDPSNVWALADRGLSYAWQRDFTNAEKDLAAAQALDPANAVTYRARGLMSEFQQDFQSAADNYSKSLQIDPGNTFALFHRIVAYEALSKFDDALRELNAILARDPKDKTALSQRAWLYLQQNKLEEAEADLSAALSIDPADPATLMTKSVLASRRGDEKGAVDALSEVLKTSPDDAGALTKRAQAYYAAGEIEKALADTEAAAKIGSMPPEARLTRANIFRAQGKHDAVVREAELLVSENPKSDFALVAAGKIFAAEGQRQKALGAIDQAIKVRPAAYIYINRSQVREAGDYAGKLADLNEALKLEPNEPEALAFKAEILVKQKQFAEAIRLYDSAISAAPGDKLDLRRVRAVALYKAGRVDEAEKELAAIRAQTTKPLGLNNLCWTEASAGILLEAAVEDCRKAVQLRPDVSSYQDSLGMALLRLNKLDEAIKAYSDAIEKSHIASSYMGRAFAYAQKGDMAHANADRAEAVKLDSDIESEFSEFGLHFPGPKAQASN